MTHSRRGPGPPSAQRIPCPRPAHAQPTPCWIVVPAPTPPPLSTLLFTAVPTHAPHCSLRTHQSSLVALSSPPPRPRPSSSSALLSSCRRRPCCISSTVLPSPTGSLHPLQPLPSDAQIIVSPPSLPSLAQLSSHTSTSHPLPPPHLRAATHFGCSFPSSPATWPINRNRLHRLRRLHQACPRPLPLPPTAVRIARPSSRNGTPPTGRRCR